jgi:hypothetical protein
MIVSLSFALLRVLSAVLAWIDIRDGAHAVLPLHTHRQPQDAGEICVVKKVAKKRKIEGFKEEDAQVDIMSIVERVPEEELMPERVDRLAGIITSNWKMRCKLGLSSDLAG